MLPGDGFRRDPGLASAISPALSARPWLRSLRQISSGRQRQLRDGSRLGPDGHLAVSLRNIARTVTLNGIQDAVLDAGSRDDNQTLTRQNESVRVF